LSCIKLVLSTTFRSVFVDGDFDTSAYVYVSANII
jgi:hypothetical protein